VIVVVAAAALTRGWIFLCLVCVCDVTSARGWFVDTHRWCSILSPYPPCSFLAGNTAPHERNCMHTLTHPAFLVVTTTTTNNNRTPHTAHRHTTPPMRLPYNNRHMVPRWKGCCCCRCMRCCISTHACCCLFVYGQSVKHAKHSNLSQTSKDLNSLCCHFSSPFLHCNHHHHHHHDLLFVVMYKTN